ncbi:MAG TPA: crossover junction endodeoxyribonuclease RuvC [Dehalococcoidia bacterium]|nr:crossover junction endodeoxyribonuclease RuvC [Dehalococcoidia bacterium]
MRILGVDPGLRRTGYGVIGSDAGGITLIEGGVIRCALTEQPLPVRLLEIHRGIAEVIAEYRPRVVALEQLFSHYGHPRTAILMGHARGVICLAAAEAGLSVHDYPAARIKAALTGSGRASKDQMQRMIQRLLALEELPSPHDVADALAVAICHGTFGHRPDLAPVAPR